jgi:methyl-accepting chemotaxis protein
MGSINESSKKIVDIISVIDGIAFQTNILALNAAVEAARAGEQGRGFAVVAAEVRSLAHRSAEAAKEIKTLIVDSVEKVDAGAKLVDQAGATMKQVVESVKRVSDIIGEIAAAGNEQSAGIEQINRAIMEMDNTTQQNAVLVEQASAAAESLQDQAANLAQVVSVFKTDAVHTASVAPLKSASAPARVKTVAIPRLAATGNATSPAIL